MTNRPEGRDSLAAIWRRSIPGLALVLVAVSTAAAAAPGDDQPSSQIGQPVSLVVQPESIRLSGPRATQQIVVTGRYGDGGERDLTPFAVVTAEGLDVVTVRPGGFLHAHK